MRACEAWAGNDLACPINKPSVVRRPLSYGPSSDGLKTESEGPYDFGMLAPAANDPPPPSCGRMLQNNTTKNAPDQKTEPPCPGHAVQQIHLRLQCCPLAPLDCPQSACLPVQHCLHNTFCALAQCYFFCPLLCAKTHQSLLGRLQVSVFATWEGAFATGSGAPSPPSLPPRHSPTQMPPLPPRTRGALAACSTYRD